VSHDGNRGQVMMGGVHLTATNLRTQGGRNSTITTALLLVEQAFLFMFRSKLHAGKSTRSMSDPRLRPQD